MESNTEPAIKDDFAILNELIHTPESQAALDRIEEKVSNYVPKDLFENELRDHKITKDEVARLEEVNDTLMIDATQRQQYITSLEEEVARLREGIQKIADNPGNVRRQAAELLEEIISPRIVPSTPPPPRPQIDKPPATEIRS